MYVTDMQISNFYGIIRGPESDAQQRLITVQARRFITALIIFRVEIGPFNVPFYQCVTHGFYTEPWQEQVYVTTSLLLMFVLPLATLVITYGTTFRTIANLPALHCGEFDSNLCRSGSQQRTSLSTAVAKLESIRPMRCGTTANSHPMEVTRRRLLARAKKKSLMITVVIVVAFIVCWTPYYAMMVIFIFNLDPGQKITGELQSAIFFFGSSTAMINPAIYGAFHLRRPRTTKLRNSTVVLSAAAFRKPSSNSPSVATTTLGRRRNQKKSHHTRVRHYLISKSPSNTLPVYASQQHEPGELPKMEVEVRLEAS
ncbi:vasopressin V1b receptor-like isoform X2 [Varroa destructor]|uniref:G-protein coupled receptors family 1 profile domain-containing protein n=1 Tax=Varroa destructor TaxID=109461 RepID=A0A7M7JT13_VARDE|nr:vasopressin V1b receptor-like isoform X2 [Varroa destructor]